MPPREYPLVDVEAFGGDDSPIFKPTQAESTPKAGSLFVLSTAAPIQATAILILIQIFFYILSVWIITPRGLIEPTQMSLLRIGSMLGSIAFPCFLHGHIFEIRRFLFANFLHSGLIHLFMNVVFQVSLSPRFEGEFGSIRFAKFFVSCAIFGSLVAGAFQPNTPSVGASTACYGLLGAEYMKEYMSWPSYNDETKRAVKSRLMIQSFMLVGWEIMNWFTISHFGHIGGFVAGICLYPHLAAGTGGGSVREDEIRKKSTLILGFIVGISVVAILIPTLSHWDQARKDCNSFARIYS